jgi:hypothetical protein
MKRDYPTWICNDCGVRHCKGAPEKIYATFHIGTCQCCMVSGIPVTEPRDYGHFVEWPVTIDYENVKSDTGQNLG